MGVSPLKSLVTSAALALTLLGFAPSGEARFLKLRSTGLYTYSDPSGSVTVVVSQRRGLDGQESPQGILVLAGPPISPQEFNLEQASLKDYAHAFFRFSTDATGQEAFSELFLGNSAPKFKIAGDVTVNVGGRVSVGIANRSYLTISTTGSGGGFLAFVGTQIIIEGDNSLAAILAANQLDSASAKLIRPYRVEQGQPNLLLEVGTELKPVTNRTIGVDLSDRLKQTRCLKPQAVVINNRQLKEMRQAKSDAEKVALFDRFSKETKKAPLTRNLIFLRVTPTSAIALDPIAQSVRELREIPTSSSQRRICLLDDLDVSP
jgi:hypothetical protein